MTERDIKQLIKLLDKFRIERERDGGGNAVERDSRIGSVIVLVTQWVKWHGRDELSMDL